MVVCGRPEPENHSGGFGCWGSGSVCVSDLRSAMSSSGFARGFVLITCHRGTGLLMVSSLCRLYEHHADQHSSVHDPGLCPPPRLALPRRPGYASQSVLCPQANHQDGKALEETGFLDSHLRNPCMQRRVMNMLRKMLAPASSSGLSKFPTLRGRSLQT